MNTLEIVMIPVADQQKAKEFYLQLGFTVLVEAPDAHGGSWIQMSPPGGGAAISLAKFHGLIYETNDIEMELDSLKGRGLQTGNIDNTPWGRFAWLKDLDGNSLCLHQK